MADSSTRAPAVSASGWLEKRRKSGAGNVVGVTSTLDGTQIQSTQPGDTIDELRKGIQDAKATRDAIASKGQTGLRIAELAARDGPTAIKEIPNAELPPRDSNRGAARSGRSPTREKRNLSADLAGAAPKSLTPFQKLISSPPPSASKSKVRMTDAGVGGDDPEVSEALVEGDDDALMAAQMQAFVSQQLAGTTVPALGLGIGAMSVPTGMQLASPKPQGMSMGKGVPSGIRPSGIGTPLNGKAAQAASGRAFLSPPTPSEAVSQELFREVIREVPVEVIREVIKEVIREVPVERIREVPVIQEVVREVIREVQVPVVQTVETVRVQEVIKEVPVEIVKEIFRTVEVPDPHVMEENASLRAELSARTGPDARLQAELTALRAEVNARKAAEADTNSTERRQADAERARMSATLEAVKADAHEEGMSLRAELERKSSELASAQMASSESLRQLAIVRDVLAKTREGAEKDKNRAAAAVAAAEETAKYARDAQTAALAKLATAEKVVASTSRAASRRSSVASDNGVGTGAMEGTGKRKARVVLDLIKPEFRWKVLSERLLSRRILRSVRDEEDRLEADLAAVNKDISALRSSAKSVVAAESAASHLRSEVEALTHDLLRVDAIAVATGEKLAEVQAWYNVSQEENAGLRKRMTNLDGKVTSLQAQSVEAAASGKVPLRRSPAKSPQPYVSRSRHVSAVDYAGSRTGIESSHTAQQIGVASVIMAGSNEPVGTERNEALFPTNHAAKASPGLDSETCGEGAKQDGTPMDLGTSRLAASTARAVSLAQSRAMGRVPIEALSPRMVRMLESASTLHPPSSVLKRMRAAEATHGHLSPAAAAVVTMAECVPESRSMTVPLSTVRHVQSEATRTLLNTLAQAGSGSTSPVPPSALASPRSASHSPRLTGSRPMHTESRARARVGSPPPNSSADGGAMPRSRGTSPVVRRVEMASPIGSPVSALVQHEETATVAEGDSSLSLQDLGSAKSDSAVIDALPAAAPKAAPEPIAAQVLRVGLVRSGVGVQGRRGIGQVMRSKTAHQPSVSMVSPSSHMRARTRSPHLSPKIRYSSLSPRNNTHAVGASGNSTKRVKSPLPPDVAAGHAGAWATSLRDPAVSPLPGNASPITVPLFAMEEALQHKRAVSPAKGKLASPSPRHKGVTVSVSSTSKPLVRAPSLPEMRMAITPGTSPATAVYGEVEGVGSMNLGATGHRSPAHFSPYSRASAHTLDVDASESAPQAHLRSGDHVNRPMSRPRAVMSPALGTGAASPAQAYLSYKSGQEEGAREPVEGRAVSAPPSTLKGGRDGGGMRGFVAAVTGRAAPLPHPGMALRTPGASVPAPASVRSPSPHAQSLSISMTSPRKLPFWLPGQKKQETGAGVGEAGEADECTRTASGLDPSVSMKALSPERASNTSPRSVRVVGSSFGLKAMLSPVQGTRSPRPGSPRAASPPVPPQGQGNSGLLARGNARVSPVRSVSPKTTKQGPVSATGSVSMSVGLGWGGKAVGQSVGKAALGTGMGMGLGYASMSRGRPASTLTGPRAQDIVQAISASRLAPTPSTVTARLSPSRDEGGERQAGGGRAASARSGSAMKSRGAGPSRSSPSPARRGQVPATPMHRDARGEGPSSLISAVHTHEFVAAFHPALSALEVGDALALAAAGAAPKGALATPRGPSKRRPSMSQGMGTAVSARKDHPSPSISLPVPTSRPVVLVRPLRVAGT